MLSGSGCEGRVELGWAVHARAAIHLDPLEAARRLTFEIYSSHPA
jgi:hypothetical protein